MPPKPKASRLTKAKVIAAQLAKKRALEKKPLPASGAGLLKRTPSGHFDPNHDAKKVWEVDDIIAEKTVKRGRERKILFLVKWKGYPSSANTWEPLEHITGNEQIIRRMREEKEVKNAAAVKAAEEKVALQAAEKEKRRQREAEVLSDSDVATDDQNDDDYDDDDDQVEGETIVEQTSIAGESIVLQKSVPGKTDGRVNRKPTSQVWKYFQKSTFNADYAECTLTKKGSSEVCGECIKKVGGTSAMWKHLQHHHVNEFLDGKKDQTIGGGGAASASSQSSIVIISATKRAELNNTCAEWVTESMRPLNITGDPGLKRLLEQATDGAYKPPPRDILRGLVLQLGQKGLDRLKSRLKDLIAHKQKVGVATDIWSDGGMALFGAVLYEIDSEWNLNEWLLAADDFSDKAHTGESIKDLMMDVFKEMGMSADDVEYKTNDNASNIVNGMDQICEKGAGCVVHTMELAVNTFANAPGIKEVIDKGKAVTAYFSHATGVAGLQAYLKCQKEIYGNAQKPQAHVVTRWTSWFQQTEHYRTKKKALQDFEINHCKDAVFNKCKFFRQDFVINEQICGILSPFNSWTIHMQGSKYPTCCLILPTVYTLIDWTRRGATRTFHFGEDAKGPPMVIRHDDLEECVSDAIEVLHVDIKERFIEKIEGTETEVSQFVSTIMHPCFNHCQFTSDENVSEEKRKWALAKVRERFNADFKPPAVQPSAAVAVPATKKRRVGLAGLMQSVNVVAESAAAAAPAPAPAPPVRDELDEYLSLAQNTDLELNVLLWWRGNEVRWPNLCRMAKTILAPPASSAGVERVFSAAGRMHGDEQKNKVADTMKYSLFAHHNLKFGQ